MTKKTVFLLNGPPRCGKSTLARHLVTRMSAGWSNFVFSEKFARPLDGVARVVTWLDDDDFIDYREAKKDELLPAATGCGDLSLRQLYIMVSEQWIKPSFGKDWFGVAAANRVKAAFDNSVGKDSVCIIDDCGFQAELDAFVRELKQDDEAIEIYVVSIKREGCDFSGDSREYVQRSPTLRKHNVDFLEINNDAKSAIVFSDRASEEIAEAGFFKNRCGESQSSTEGK